MMPRLDSRLPLPACVLGLCLQLFAGSIALATDYFATPTGAGDRNGSAWDHALPASRLAATLESLQPGDTLHVGSGTYHHPTPLTITGHGTADAPITLTGVDTGDGLPLFQGDYDVHDTTGAYEQPLLQFPGAASHWQIKNLRLSHYGVGVQMTAHGTTTDLRHHLRFDNVDGEYVEDFFRLQNASDVTVHDCDVIRYTKKGFRFIDYIDQLTFTACTADANGGDDAFPTRAIPNGFCGGDTEGEPRIRNVTFIDCTARNNRYQPQQRPYWNGDGFSTEEGTNHVTYIRCRSFDNHDGGFDDKADNATFIDCIAIGNAKGFRYWGNNGVYQNCLSAFNQAHGGTNASDGLWVGVQRRGNIGVARVYDSTFYHNGQWALEAYEAGQISATNCIIVVDDASRDAAPTEGAGVRLVNPAIHRTSDAGSNDDPDFVAPSPDWEGEPADAFDSRLYRGSKGYHSSHRTRPVAPTYP